MLSYLIRRSVDILPWQWRLRVKDLPIIAPLQRWLVARFLDNREFVHEVTAGPAKGLKFPVRMPQDKAIWSGTWEPAFATALAQAVHPGAVCYDVGGYRGFYSGVFACSGASKVYVFEPNPQNCTCLDSLVSLNPQAPIQLFRMALGDHRGPIGFNLMSEATMGKVSSSPFQPDAVPSRAISVEMTTLDLLFEAKQIREPQVIKIDVEGAEVLVLRGAKRVLETFHPAIFLEVHSHELARECAEFLGRLGYSYTILETGNLPDFVTEPPVCHLVARWAAQSNVGLV